MLNSSTRFNKTDLGNAERFVQRHGRDFRFCYNWNKWLYFDGVRWRRDDLGERFVRAKETVKSLYHEAAEADPNDRISLARHAARSESDSRIRAMLSLAASEPGIPVRPGELDRDGHLLNVENGTVDLRSGERLLHDRKDLITKLAPVHYWGDSEAPIWNAFLRQILGGDRELIRFLQRAIGYALTGENKEQVFFILYGSGANGKSTFLNTIQCMLGDYAKQTPVETLLVKTGQTIPNDLARLNKTRFVVAAESDAGKRLAEGTIKQLTGGDTISARFLHGEFFEFVPEMKIFLSTNHKPVITGTDYAIWRRICLIPFTVTIPPEEQDKELPKRLQTEMPGIFRWAVEGARAWYKEGLKIPEPIRASVETYRLEMDSVSGFIEDQCELQPGRKVLNGELYERYRNFCENTGKEAVSKRIFTSRLMEFGVSKSRTTGGYYQAVGIGLKGA